MSLLIPKGYLEDAMIEELAVETKARNAPMLIIMPKILPPNALAPSDIGVSVPLKFSGSKTPTVTEISKA